MPPPNVTAFEGEVILQDLPGFANQVMAVIRWEETGFFG